MNMERDRLIGGLFVWAESIIRAMTAAPKSSILKAVKAKRSNLICVDHTAGLPQRDVEADRLYDCVARVETKLATS